jgi:hypothetical protein
MTESSINSQVQKQLQSILSQATPDNASEQAQLNNALRLLSKWTHSSSSVKTGTHKKALKPHQCKLTLLT